jgi:hypothetical protein
MGPLGKLPDAGMPILIILFLLGSCQAKGACIRSHCMHCPIHRLYVTPSCQVKDDIWMPVHVWRNP